MNRTTYIPSPHVAIKEQQIKRLYEVIKNEGASLTNEDLRKRFSLIGLKIIQRIRKEVGVSQPGSTYLTEHDMRNRSIKYGSARPPSHNYKK